LHGLVERFMKHYFLVAKDVGDLTRIFFASLEAREVKRARACRPGARPLRGSDIRASGLNDPDFRHRSRAPDRCRQERCWPAIRSICIRLFALAPIEDSDEVHPDALKARRSPRRW
jgi:[protein-PII] uridylyltransferase